MADIAILTACMGAYDDLQPQRHQDIEVDWIAVTDDMRPVPEPWQAVRVPPAEGEHPRMAAKAYKLLPYAGYRDVIWIDANAEVLVPTFAGQALAARRNGIAVWSHPHRRCIYREATASVRLDKYDGRQIAEQIVAYKAEGHPANWGLYACGVVAWDWSNEMAHKLGQAWLDECRLWSYQDQISLPVVCRRLAVRPGTFPLRQLEQAGEGFGNRWIRLHPHRSEA